MHHCYSLTMIEYLTTAQSRRIAYHQTTGSGPGVVFLGGFRSDMQGTKALFLQDWAVQTGRAFLRFDYSAHGQSSGNFVDGSIGDWADDAAAALMQLTSGPQILVGSSMGGWISLLLARKHPDRIAGLIGVAAAPDFTEDALWSGFSTLQKADLVSLGRVDLPSDYGDPAPITARLIEDGRHNLVLRSPLAVSFPVRLLHGTADADVPPSVGLRLLDHLCGSDVQLTLVKAADHRFSSPDCLALIRQAIADIDQRVARHG